MTPTRRINRDQFLSLLKADAPHQVVFDIETGPLPLAEIEQFYSEKNLKLPDPPADFDPAKVKFGRTRDPVKKAEIVASARARHFQSLVEYQQDITKLKNTHRIEFIRDAALHPHLGQILAVGYGYFSGKEILTFLDIDLEYDMIERFWKVIVAAVRHRRGSLIHFNGNTFDIPFLTRRAWYNKFLPPYVLTRYNKIDDYFTDILKYYQLGVYNAYISLDNLAKALKVPGKSDGITGDKFAQLFIEDREKAEEYLRSDILCTFRVAESMGLFEQVKPILRAKVVDNAEIVA